MRTCAVEGCDRKVWSKSPTRVNCDDHLHWVKGKPPQRKPQNTTPHVCRVCDASLEGEHHSKRYCLDHNPAYLDQNERVELARQFPNKVHLIYK